MKRNACLAALAACIAAGAVRFWDLTSNSEAWTGFVTRGSVWLRYGVLALLVICFFALSKLVRTQRTLAELALPQPPLLAVTAVCALFSGGLGVQYAVEQFVFPSTSLGHAEGGAALLAFALGLRLAFALSMMLFGVWCALLALRRQPLCPKAGVARVLGFFGVVAFCVLPLLRYAENPASVSRILRILPICSALAAMLFVVKLLGTLCVTLTPARRGEVAFAGLCAFLLCTCVELPQLLWQMQAANVTPLELATGATLGLLGCVGAAMALAVSKE